jgi:hypothetical protein
MKSFWAISRARMELVFKVSETVSYSSLDESVRSTSVANKRQGDQRGARSADKEAYTVHSANIISEQQYFVARCLCSYVGNVCGLRSFHAFVFLLPTS